MSQQNGRLQNNVLSDKKMSEQNGRMQKNVLLA